MNVPRPSARVLAARPSAALTPLTLNPMTTDAPAPQPHTTDAPPGDHPSPDGRFCIRCAYTLTGLRWDGLCPECSTPIALSVREPALADADRAYVTTIRSGLSLVLNGTMVMLFFFGARIIYGTALHTLGAAPGPLAVEIAAQCFALVVLFAVMRGYWKYTEPDPGQVAVEVTRSARSWIRLAVVGVIALSVAVFAIEQTQAITKPPPAPSPASTAPASTTPGAPTPAAAPVAPPSRSPLEIARIMVSVLTLGAWSVLFVAMMRYTRWLGTRVPDLLIVRQTRTYMWLLPIITIGGTLLIAIGFLLSLLMYWTLLHRVNTHLKSIESSGKPASLKNMVAPD